MIRRDAEPSFCSRQNKVLHQKGHRIDGPACFDAVPALTCCSECVREVWLFCVMMLYYQGAKTITKAQPESNVINAYCSQLGNGLDEVSFCTGARCDQCSPTPKTIAAARSTPMLH